MPSLVLPWGTFAEMGSRVYTKLAKWYSMQMRNSTGTNWLPSLFFALLFLLTSCGSGPSAGRETQVTLTLDVSVPPDTPASAEVVVRGTHGIEPDLVEETVVLTAASSQTHQGSLELPQEAEFAFQIHLANPARVEVSETLEPVAPHLFSATEDGSLNLEVMAWGIEPASGQGVARFRIATPGSTPNGAEVWISGNQPALGDWNGAGLQARPTSTGLFVAQVELPLQTRVEYKVTRGDWSTVEKGPQGEEIQNRTFTVSDPVSIRNDEVEHWADQVVDNRPSTRTGLFELHEDVASAFLELPRDVLVYLPPDYNATTDRY
ncbi:MAG: hypothetical protein HKN21_12160, partial [Candidatus Eisenbacteria bacterium]|nr:hypothetical protein [Candidatus Eisenbacteria bacterium]